MIWGDKKYVLASLLPEFAGKVNLIYIDPPFDTGADFSFTATIPNRSDDDESESSSFIKEPSIIEQKAYRDTWGRGLDSYIEWFYEAAALASELLDENGSINVHLDWHVGHYAKAVVRAKRLLELRVLCLRLLQDGQVGIGVLPQAEEILVGSF